MSSGNLTDAKSALEQLNSAIPKTSDSSNDPMKSKLETLTKAVNSGDLSSAQSAYSDLKSSMPQRPSGPPPSDMSQLPDESQSGTSTSDGGLDILA